MSIFVRDPGKLALNERKEESREETEGIYPSLSWRANAALIPSARERVIPGTFVSSSILAFWMEDNVPKYRKRDCFFSGPKPGT